MGRVLGGRPWDPNDRPPSMFGVSGCPISGVSGPASGAGASPGRRAVLPSRLRWCRGMRPGPAPTASRPPAAYPPRGGRPPWRYAPATGGLAAICAASATARSSNSRARHHVFHQADGQRLGRVDGTPCQDHIQCPRRCRCRRNSRWVPPLPGIRPRLTSANAGGGIAGVRHVAQQREFHAAADGQAVDGGDDGFVEGGDAFVLLPAKAAHFGDGLARAGPGEFAQVTYPRRRPWARCRSVRRQRCPDRRRGSSSVSRSLCRIRMLMAFIACGRFRLMTATWPWRVTSMVSEEGGCHGVGAGKLGCEWRARFWLWRETGAAGKIQSSA